MSEKNLESTVKGLLGEVNALKRELSRHDSFETPLLGLDWSRLVKSCSLYVTFDGINPERNNWDCDLLSRRNQYPTCNVGTPAHPGKFGKAGMYSYARTNKVNNPILGSTSGYAAVGGTMTASRGDDPVLYGTHSLRCTFSGAAGEYLQLTLTALANQNHVFSFRSPYSWLASSGQQIQVSVDGGANYNNVSRVDGGGANIGLEYPQDASTNEGAKRGWYVYYVVLPAGQCNGSTALRLRLNPAVAMTVDFDGFQIEESSGGVMTPLCHGDMPSHTWAGTAHNSASSRSANYTRYPDPLVAEAKRHATITGWWRPAFINPNGTHVLFDNNRFRLRYDGTNSRFELTDNTNTIQFSYTITPYEWIHFAAQYQDGSPMSLYINGVLVGTSTYTRYVTQTYLWIGTDQTGANPINGWMDDFAVFERTLTAKEIYAIARSRAPLAISQNVQLPMFLPYTPVWMSASNPQPSGGTLRGEYAIWGKMCWCSVYLNVNGAANLGSGQWRFSLPFNAQPRTSYSVPYYTGACYMIDAGTMIYNGVATIAPTAGQFIFINPHGNAVTVRSTSPFAWSNAANDELTLSIIYALM